MKPRTRLVKMAEKSWLSRKHLMIVSSSISATIEKMIMITDPSTLEQLFCNRQTGVPNLNELHRCIKRRRTNDDFSVELLRQ